MWGAVLKRDLLGEVREEDKFHSKEELQEYLRSEIERQGKHVVIKNLDVSLIEDLGGLFTSISIIDGVESLDLSGWKTSNVKNINHMFYDCTNLESLDLSGWDTSNVEDMRWIFCVCESLKSIDMSGWKTSNVKNMSSMFYDCSCLKSLDLSDWDISNVEDMSDIFTYCENLESLDLSGWDTSNVKDMSDMFYGCPAPYKVVGNQIVRK